MNSIALCSSVLLFLSLITCSEVDDFDGELMDGLEHFVSHIERYNLIRSTWPEMEPLTTTPREFVDDPVMNSEYTRFLVWYMIPQEIRNEILDYYLLKGPFPIIINCRPPPGLVIISRDRYTDVEPEAIIEKVENDRDWINLSNEYLLNAKLYNQRSQLIFLIEAIKNASPNSIEEIFQRRPHALVLLKKIQTKASEELVNFILDSRKITSDIIEIFRILERYSDFDMADQKYLAKIRSAAYERDDCELLMFTNAYPDLIRPSGLCQSDLLDIAIKGDEMPRVWSLICDNVHKSAKICYCGSVKCRFIKFKLFSEPVNRECWSLDMHAVAFQKYETALKLPLEIVRTKNIPYSAITTKIQNISQMIPLIPDPVYRQRFIEKYNLRSMNPDTFITSFTHLNQSGKSETVRVIPYCEQKDNIVEYAPPVRIADTVALVLKIIH